MDNLSTSVNYLPKHNSGKSKPWMGLVDRNDPAYKIKQAIWVYFFLLIFEGALRKWVLPFLATPLLLVRDPIALYIIWHTYKKHLVPANIYVVLMTIVTVISVFATILAGHGNLLVDLFGARIYLLHFPLIFIIGKLLNRDDVTKIGKMLLWLTIGMSVLLFLQFFSPQSAWVNRGVGGDEAGAGFSGALGYMRPPATFSFTNGTTLYYSFVAPFIFYFWIQSYNIKRWLLIAATAALLISIPLSISRALLFSMVITLVFLVIGISRKPKYLYRILTACLFVVLSFFLLSQFEFFQSATGAFTSRFTSANESEGGLNGVLGDRYLGAAVRSFETPVDFPFWGYGLGKFTNFGAQKFRLDALPEGEWEKIIYEQGLILGAVVIFIRLFFSTQVLFASYKQIRFNDLLPWLLLSNFLINVPQAQWKQPTSLGFSVVIGGLTLASLNKNKKLVTLN